MIRVSNNGGHGPRKAELEIVVESDSMVFLGVTLNDPDGNVVVDYYTADAEAIEEFFDDVDRAKADFERLGDS